ncbi:MAG: queuosine precursor transporter, partial [Chloroflexi bacterium]|nr:queuosine precursor transporter [Chloroflexota bacterium]
GFTPRLLIGSFFAYLGGEFANSIILAKMKIRTKGRYLWARTIGSTIVGQGIDASIFILVAFIGTIPLPVIGNIILMHWLVKVSYEVVATPFTYRVVNYLKKKEAIDTFDYEVNFNPLLITE